MVLPVRVKKVVSAKSKELGKVCRDIDVLTAILVADPQNEDKINECEPVYRNWQSLLQQVLNTNNLVLHCEDVSNKLSDDRFCLVEFDYISDGMIYCIDEVIDDTDCEVIELREYLVKVNKGLGDGFRKLFEEQAKQNQDKANEIINKMKNLDVVGGELNE